MTLSLLLHAEIKTNPGNHFGCPESEFKCDNNKCLAKVFQCDGNPDCADESDEKNCHLGEIVVKLLIWSSFNLFITEATTKPVICPDGEWRCKNDECILGHFICDNQVDCFDGSDEDEELCGNHNWTNAINEESLPNYNRKRDKDFLITF